MINAIHSSLPYLYCAGLAGVILWFLTDIVVEIINEFKK
jgi:hypothetical protein